MNRLVKIVAWKAKPQILCGLLVVSVAWLLVACSTTSVRNPLPDKLSAQAAAIGMSDVRFWGDETPANINTLIKEKLAQMRQARPDLFESDNQLRLPFVTNLGHGSDCVYGYRLV